MERVYAHAKLLDVKRKPESWKITLEKGVLGVSEKVKAIWAKQPSERALERVSHAYEYCRALITCQQLNISP